LQAQGGTAEVIKDICMHIAFAKPRALTKADVDPQLVQQEREIQTERARKEGKPENIIPKMIEGRMKDFYAATCLLEQPFVKDNAKTVGQIANEAGVKIDRFVLWEIGKE
jgi:elongation factor Ts